jgi:protein tyrosine phosphatase
MSAKAKYNVEKNRNPDLVPVDSSRIVLAPKPGVEGSDYINASW